jgi:hypothetical protein
MHKARNIKKKIEFFFLFKPNAKFKRKRRKNIKNTLVDRKRAKGKKGLKIENTR